jgi:uncharacterized protein (UPF0261 family)
MPKKTIAVLATLDTKGAEAHFLRKQLKELGSKALVVDMGVLGEPAARADVSRKEVARAGGTLLAELVKNRRARPRRRSCRGRGEAARERSTAAKSTA